MAAADDTVGGDSFKSPGTGQGPTDSQSPLSDRNSGADPNNIGPGSIGPDWTTDDPVNKQDW